MKPDREITYTDMSMHLIEEHGFYQGTGSPYHLEIGEIAGILEITPDGSDLTIP